MTATRHRFGTGERRVWVGDVLLEYTGRVRGRGFFHRGEHFDRPLTVKVIQESLRPKASDDAIPLRTVLHNPRFYGIVAKGEQPQMMTATLEIIPQVELLMSIPALDSAGG